MYSWIQAAGAVVAHVGNLLNRDGVVTITSRTTVG
ncbi:hypothetical protein E3T38_05580 [Cryobacterium sp. Hb1]|nr:hypothetical protein E3T38_05580 [Cryobacterium sp. Hb1]